MKFDNRFNALLGVTVVSNVGVGLVIPILPNYLHKAGLSIPALGMPFTMLVLGRLCSRLFAPWVIARMGHRTVAASMFLLYSVVLACYLGASNLLQFDALRFLEGIIEGVLAIALNDLAIAWTSNLRNEERVAAMGRFGAAFGLGFLLGPLLGSFVSYLADVRGVFAAGAIVTAGAAVLAASWLASDKPRQRAPLSLAASGELVAVYCPQWLRRVAFLSLMILLPLQVTGPLHLRGEVAGLLFSASAILSTTVMPLASKISKRIGARTTVIYGLFLIGVTLLTLGITKDPYTFMVVFLLETLCFAIAIPPAMSEFGFAVDERPDRTSIVATLSLFTEIVSLPVTLLLPWLYARQPLAAWVFIAGMSFVTCGAFKLGSRWPRDRAGTDAGSGTRPTHS
ncbi:MFS transporter [Burkholderia multivorans]|uniref:MFS transporter n=1 Tax=Burkholderia multivorans TaxID=87883 RepID=UPI0007586951|nr:MFS transporter [Burkholderia multivorans]KVR40765.1 hypothetical protein WK17_21435 [Burkholderia multivorans]